MFKKTLTAKPTKSHVNGGKALCSYYESSADHDNQHLLTLQESIGNQQALHWLGVSRVAVSTDARADVGVTETESSNGEEALALEEQEELTPDRENPLVNNVLASIPPPADDEEDAPQHGLLLQRKAVSDGFGDSEYVTRLSINTPAALASPQTRNSHLNSSDTVSPQVSAAETNSIENGTRSSSTPRLIEEQSTQAERPEQMDKATFLSQLRRDITQAADTAMAGSGFSAQDCPWIDMYLRFYEDRSAERIERDLLRFAPEAQGARSAQDYIPLIATRVQRSVTVWLESGDITGVPEGIPTGLSGFGLVGRLLFKAGPGGPASHPHPVAVQSQLGRGQALAPSVQSRMGAVFGQYFSQVRVHTDAHAAGLANRYNARAFTIGHHVAFGVGEYQPSTVAGDALIAHELAHVVQQSDIDQHHSAINAPYRPETQDTSALEKSADNAALGATLQLWGHSQGSRGFGFMSQRIAPLHNGGLRLLRCASRQARVRNPRDMERQFNTARQEFLSSVSDRRVRDELSGTLDVIWILYQHDMEDAGTDTDRQAQAQQRLMQRIQSLRDTNSRIVAMSRRYGIRFMSGFSRRRQQQQPIRYDLALWTREELDKVDAVLRMIQRDAPERENYLANVDTIKREPRSAGSTTESIRDVPASWEQSTGTIRVFDRFFLRPVHETTRYLLHEIGHSTYRAQDPQRPETQGAQGFPSLPPDAWMQAAGWRVATQSNLGRQLGQNDRQSRDTLEALTERKAQQRNRPVPLHVNQWYVVYDKYESGATPTRFFFYHEDRDDEFVKSPLETHFYYSKTHPAEDLAESFAFYLYDPQVVPIQTSARETLRGPKLDYLRQRYPRPLRTSRVQRKARNHQTANADEQQADRMATQVVQRQARGDAPADNNGPGSDQPIAGSASQRGSFAALVSNLVAGRGLNQRDQVGLAAFIVDDDTAQLQAGQMRRSAFLAELRDVVCRSADEELRAAGQTTLGCPYLERWFDYYQRQNSQHIERAVHRYAPETATAQSARAYIPLVTERVRRGVSTWVRTGEITGVPPGVAIPSASIGDFFSGVIRSVAGFISGSRERVQRKPIRNRTGTTQSNVAAVPRQLGNGIALQGRVRSRMEGAFGRRFDSVRLHTGVRASRLSNSLDARAFTVGDHIAFGHGEFRPGTLMGDALIAHELTHVVQQSGAQAANTVVDNPARNRELEAAADQSAAQALSLLEGSAAMPARFRGHSPPTLNAGLRLQRCASRQTPASRRQRGLSDYAGMTPWQLSRVPPAEFQRVRSGDQSGVCPGILDYDRAADLARRLFQSSGVNFDIDATPSPGRVPRDRDEWPVLERNLQQLLALGNIRRDIVAREQQAPRRASQGEQTPREASRLSLRGRVRFTTRQGLAAAEYRTATEVFGIERNATQFDAEVEQLWQAFGITANPAACKTNQERRLGIFYRALLMLPEEASGSGGHYQPREDIIYLREVDLSTSTGSFLARHETVHFIGGRERTRQAFVQRFGNDWSRWWRPFEEGMAELIALESLPAGEAPPTQPAPAEEAPLPTPAPGQSVTTTSAIPERYEEWVAWVRRLIAMDKGNRAMMMRAYITGDIPAALLDLIERNPPPL